MKHLSSATINKFPNFQYQTAGPQSVLMRAKHLYIPLIFPYFKAFLYLPQEEPGEVTRVHLGPLLMFLDGGDLPDC